MRGEVTVDDDIVVVDVVDEVVMVDVADNVEFDDNVADEADKFVEDIDEEVVGDGGGGGRGDAKDNVGGDVVWLVAFPTS